MSLKVHCIHFYTSITVGLRIQLANKKEPRSLQFDFGWGAFNQPPRPIDWIPLTLKEATFQHIRLHRLEEDNNLSDFISAMDSIPATMAVILINSEDSYTLPARFYSEEQTPPVPMLVVTKETGEKLMQLVEYNPRAVEAKVETSFQGRLTPVFSVQNTPNQSTFVSNALYVYLYMNGFYIYFNCKNVGIFVD